MDVESLSDALHLDPDSGIWRASARGPVSYPDDHNAACFLIENESFWFSHRNRCITAAVRRFPPDGFILDVGGGNGYVARGLMDAGFETVLLEPGADGARNAKEGRHLPTVINATLDEARIRAGSVPNIGLFDVLEHIENDTMFVRRMFELVRPGGFLYLTVPAFNWLWSMSDVDAMHYRRYTRRSLATVLANNEFEQWIRGRGRHANGEAVRLDRRCKGGNSGGEGAFTAEAQDIRAADRQHRGQTPA